MRPPVRPDAWPRRAAFRSRRVAVSAGATPNKHVAATATAAMNAGTRQPKLRASRQPCSSDASVTSARAPHPGCAYRWMRYASSARVQAQVARYFGATPVNREACALLGQAACSDVHLDAPARFLRRIAFRHTPVGQHDDLVGIHHGGQAVCDHQRGAVARHGAQRRLNVLLGPRV